MHPIEFKEKWKLTHDQLALVLGYPSSYTIRRWFRNGKNRRQPQNVVCVACGLLNDLWEREGKTINCYLVQR
ncbi:hypothetical protein WKK05_40520 (plasmid) [Nostoc sp. UHCC 0302]|uniref:hypothetical protein n=1 Tax=Nostoc sp. UHCC 0302 TaxID=3134896 RepID=UPI00311CCEC0